MNSKFKFYALVTGLILSGSRVDAVDETGNSSKTSPHTREAILAGFPSYDGTPRPLPAEKSPTAESDPDVLILPAFKVSESSGQKIGRFEPIPISREKTLVAGTGVTQFKFKKVIISIPRIFFIPVGFSIDW